jgi:hypothetical protein
MVGHAASGLVQIVTVTSNRINQVLILQSTQANDLPQYIPIHFPWQRIQ